MPDGLLRFVMNFDWISPLAAITMDIANGPSHTFLIPLDCGWSGREITNLLAKRGVKTWGLMAINDTFTISVRQAQARWAQYLLDQAGIPLESPLPNVPNDRAAGRAGPHARSQTLGDDLKSILNDRIW